MTALLHMPAEQLRQTWQSRCLAETKGKLAAVIVIVLAHSHTNEIKHLLRATFPGFRDLAAPYYCSGATIVQSGRVVADMIDRNHVKHTNVPVFENEGELVKAFRDLADRLKLDDADRVALTTAVQRWVVADLRVDHMGERKAS